MYIRRKWRDFPSFPARAAERAASERSHSCARATAQCHSDPDRAVLRRVRGPLGFELDVDVDVDRLAFFSLTCAYAYARACARILES